MVNNMSCIDNGHQYGLWSIDNENKTAWRRCRKCKFKRELPITEEICNEVKKQDEALNLFKAFQLVDNNDENLLNYLNLILEDYLNYLDRKSLILLTSRIKELEQLNIINIQDIFYIGNLDSYFELNDTDSESDSYFESIQNDELNITIDSFE